MATTPNLLIPIDIPGSTGGSPSYQWAVDNETFKTIVDSHSHLGTAGTGLQIVTAALNINADLTFGSNNATNLRSLRLTNNGAPLATGSDIGCVYEASGNLYYNNSSGTAIRLTNGTSIDISSAGGVTGMPGTTAAITYSLGLTTFIFTSASTLSASLDAGKVTIRQPGSASAKGITLQSPTSLAADYNVIFPAALPATKAGVALDASGNLSAVTPVVSNGAIMAAVNTTETIVAGGKTGGANSPSANFSVPANTLVVGSTIRFVIYGTAQASASVSNVVTIRGGANGTTADATLLTTAAYSAGNTTGNTATPFRLEVLATVTVIGASAKFGGSTCTCLANNATGGFPATIQAYDSSNAVTFNSTILNYFELTIVTGAVTSNWTVTRATAELLN